MKTRGGYAGVIIFFIVIVGLIVALAIMGIRTSFPDRAAQKQTASFFWGQSAQFSNQGAITFPGTPPVASWTIESWVKFAGPLTNASPTQTLMVSSGSPKMELVATANSPENYILTFKLGQVTLTSAPGQIIPKSWFHWAISSDAVSARLFINGRMVATSIWPANSLTKLPSELLLGASSLPKSATNIPIDGFWGEIDELRISATSRYTANFDLIHVPFESDKATLGIYHFDKSICTDDQAPCLLVDASGIMGAGHIQGLVNLVDSTVPPPSYFKCVRWSCTQVTGIGFNSCKQDADCSL